MRIGIISDIHGDLPNLQRAFKQLNALNVDTIICSGDLVNRGVDSAGVIDLIMAHDIPTVMGNHDESIPPIERNLRQSPDLRFMYMIDPLSDEHLAYLEALPMHRRFLWAGTKIFMAHGSPWSVSEYIFPKTSAAMLERVAEQASANVVILGHTHTPMVLDFGATRIINSGSIYSVRGNMGYTVRHSFAVLELPSRAVTFYDVDSGEPFDPADNMLR